MTLFSSTYFVNYFRAVCVRGGGPGNIVCHVWETVLLISGVFLFYISTPDMQLVTTLTKPGAAVTLRDCVFEDRKLPSRDALV